MKESKVMLMTNHERKKERHRKQKSAQKRNYNHSTLHGCAATCVCSYKNASTLYWFLTFRVDTQACLEQFFAVSAEDRKAGSHEALSWARINPEGKRRLVSFAPASASVGLRVV